MKRKANRRPPRQNTDGRKERKPMEGTQFLYCETRKGNPRVNIDVCQTKCKKAPKCKPLKDYQATGNPELNRPQDGRYKTRSKPLPLSKKETEKYETIRRADPLHPINRQQLKTPGEEEILLDSERGIQLTLFNFVEKEGNE